MLASVSTALHKMFGFHIHAIRKKEKQTNKHSKTNQTNNKKVIARIRFRYDIYICIWNVSNMEFIFTINNSLKAQVEKVEIC